MEWLVLILILGLNLQSADFAVTEKKIQISGFTIL